MGLTAIKGIILEELVLRLLEMIGYRIIVPGEEGTKDGRAGLEVQGRGEWHQIDAFAAFDYTPAFMYPLRLLLEAKCYDNSGPIGIEVVRNAVGVLKDISENYFTVKTNIFRVDANDTLKMQRFNYQSAIFSTSGYTRGAQRFAIAHQIFLIQYDRVSLFEPISQSLHRLRKDHFKADVLHRKRAQKETRQYVRALLKNGEVTGENPFKAEGSQFFSERIVKPLKSIRGSYFGMLQGKWPIHLLSKKPLSPDLFVNRDTIKCKIYGRNSSIWSFVPLDCDEDSPNWFRLEFDLPAEVAELVREAKGDKVEIAQVKREYFSFISVSGLIGRIRRQVRLELDEEWIDDFIRSASMRRPASRSGNED